jgi:hypothetical protein
VFDHGGWTLEEELLAVSLAAHQEEMPGTVIERLLLPRDLARFCARHQHRLPSRYAFDPRPRAAAYLARFPPSPPGRAEGVPRWCPSGPAGGAIMGA